MTTTPGLPSPLETLHLGRELTQRPIEGFHRHYKD